MSFLTLGSSYHCCSSFGEGTGPIHFTNPVCNGSEHRLNDCVNQASSCGHHEDWSVYCRIGGSFELIDYIIQHNIELVIPLLSGTRAFAKLFFTTYSFSRWT